MRTLLDLQISRDLARESDLSGSDYDVLSTLTEVPGQSWRANEPAAQLLWSTSRLAHHIGRMGAPRAGAPERLRRRRARRRRLLD